MKKRVFATLLSMLLIFSYAPTITFATGMDMEAAAVETETDEEASSGELETEGETEISTEEITESQENPDTETMEETEKATEEPSSEEDAAMPLESEETTPLLGSSFSVAETEMQTETETDEESETLCGHGNSAANCAVCDLEKQIASLPALEEIQAMTGDEEEAVYAQASALADVYYDDLTADEQAQVSNINTLWDILDYFSSGLTLTALSVDTTWYKDTDTNFTLYDAADLAGLASLVNAGNDFSGKTIKLGNNINLNSESWTPIGTTSNPFKGTFDGKGYTVQNLSVNWTSYDAGLFGYVDGSAVIKNVTVTGSVSGTYYVGGVVGRISSEVTVENCTNSASVSVSGSSTNSFVGGIVGRNKGTVSNCSNIGNVSGGSRSYVGGITGRNDNTVSNCSNTNNKVENSNSSYYTGGIVGYNYINCVVSNSYNTGAVSGTSYVGGVVGGNAGTLSNSYNTGAVSGTSYVGGVVGGIDGTLSNNYYLSDTANTVAGQTAKTAAQFASGEVAYLLNGSVSAGTTWYQNIDSGTADSYPVLDSSHGAVYYGTNCAGTAIYSNSTVPAATHSLAHVETQGATCTETGNNEYWYCSVCGGYFSDAGALGTTSLSEVTIPAKGHSWGIETVTIAATCTEDGEMTYTCTECGKTKTEAIDATGHSYEAVVTDPTCTAGGYTTYTCSVCGYSYTANETDATGHSYQAVVTDPTCTAGGYTTYTCSACGDSYTANETEATGHSYKAVVTEPTCTTGGYTTYTCSICGDSYTANETEATGHSYEAVVTEPTCTAGGYTTYTCSACGDRYTADETEATGHTWDEGTVTTAATCSARRRRYADVLERHQRNGDKRG